MNRRIISASIILAITGALYLTGRKLEKQMDAELEKLATQLRIQREMDFIRNRMDEWKLKNPSCTSWEYEAQFWNEFEFVRLSREFSK